MPGSAYTRLWFRLMELRVKRTSDDQYSSCRGGRGISRPWCKAQQLRAALSSLVT